MTRTRRLLLTVAMAGVTMVIALCAVWWWALFGMNEDIATAWGITVGGLTVVTVWCAAWAETTEDR